jgi:hypothetical protein
MGTKTQKLSNVVDQIVEWQSVFTGDGSTGLTAVAGRGYFIDTTSGTVTVTLPASPKQGDTISINDYAGTFGTNNVSLSRNGSNINGVATDGGLDANSQTVTLIYLDSTRGWQTVANAAPLTVGAAYVAATGGTVTESGDYKIHTFTGDGCFVVSSVGNSVGSDSVDYLVVAGGGGGATNGGGGGAGGVRFYASPDITSYPASPRNAPTSLPVSATTYPVTVGAGGTAMPDSPGNAPSGSNSVFSTITSAGGAGGQGQLVCAQSGGSGAGARRDANTPLGGAGNTPPTSPPQGTPGGGSQSNSYSAGGGGGGFMVAGAIGQGTGAQPDENGGNGGNGGGFPTSFVGSNGQPSGCEQYFGGGGGGGSSGVSTTYGQPGLGGGGLGSVGPVPRAATAGTANTGGGGGGAQPGPGTAGGKGIVVIRYKFQ